MGYSYQLQEYPLELAVETNLQSFLDHTVVVC